MVQYSDMRQLFAALRAKSDSFGSGTYLVCDHMISYRLIYRVLTQVSRV